MPLRRIGSKGSIGSLSQDPINTSRHGNDYYTDDDHSAMSSVVGTFRPEVGQIQRTYSGLVLEDVPGLEDLHLQLQQQQQQEEEAQSRGGGGLRRSGSSSSFFSNDRDKSRQLRRSGSSSSLVSNDRRKYNELRRSGSSSSLFGSNNNRRRRSSSRRPSLQRSFSFMWKPDPAEEQHDLEPGDHNHEEGVPYGEEGQQQHSGFKSCFNSVFATLIKLYQTYEIVILVIAAILIARAYPIIGAVWVAPHVTSSYIAVMLIFIMAGMGLRTDEFTKATQRIFFNGFIQCYSFFFISSMVYALSRFLLSSDLVIQPLADGMVICACLPATINMVTVLTRIAGGDEAAAIFNCAFGNFLGIFLSPVLILAYLGMSGDLRIGNLFFKLAIRVLTPILLGQTLQRNSKSVMKFVRKYRPYFKKGQQYLLVYIVYCVMCRTFKTRQEEGAASELSSIFVMIGLQFVLLVSFMVTAWYVVDAFFPDQPSLRCMAIFGCTHKTVAMGVPMINAIYETDPNIGLLTLPLLIWHPMQLLMGSLVAPRIGVWCDLEKQRLGIFPAPEEEEIPEDKKKNDQEEQSNTTNTTQTSGSWSAPRLPHDEEEGQRHHLSSHSSRDRRQDEYRRHSSKTMSRSRSSGSLGYDSDYDNQSYATSGTIPDDCTYTSYPVVDTIDDESLALADDQSYVERGMPFPDRRDSSSYYDGGSRRRRRLPKCRSDHSCYEVGVVYQLVTDPDVLLGLRCTQSSASKKCRGCGVRITSQVRKRGAHPTRSTPVCICMECRRYLYCYHCWRENKAPEWAHTLHDLYN